MAAVGTSPFRSARCRECRREGAKLFLKGDRCYSAKCGFSKRGFAPGQHGNKPQRKVSDYGIQLREKQKTRRIYRVMERQFRRYFHEAASQRGVTGEILLGLLEKRLDNVIYRLGLAASRNESRQLVSHKHFTVNGKMVNIPSYRVKSGDVIEVAPKSRNIAQIARLRAGGAGKTVPAWLQLDSEAYKGTVLRDPIREDIEADVQEALIVEFYSR